MCIRDSSRTLKESAIVLSIFKVPAPTILRGCPSMARACMQAMAGHAIIGDPVYCKLPEVNEEDVFEGWMLHGMYLFASELRFQHPIDCQQLVFCVERPGKFERPVGRRKKQRRRRQQQALEARGGREQEGDGVKMTV